MTRIPLLIAAACVAHAAMAGDHGHAESLQALESPTPLAARQGGPDSDDDGRDDFADNCSLIPNADQRDTDEDGFGNVCDTDLDNSGITNAVDLGLFKAVFFTADPDADFNGDGIVNVLDLGTLKAGFFQAPGPSGMSCAGSAPCPLPTLTYDWPMPGDDADEWVINNYVDLDPGAGILDFAGGAKSYNGHNGVDIDVPTFRAMDNDFPIYAVAQGTVLALDDSNFDRNTSCSGSWNFVTVGHPNGWKTIYGHLKMNSVVVNVGDVVEAGQTLGVVGSSGCSTAPHLHLETRDENDAVVEPFQLGMWNSPPTYDTVLGFMDATLYNAPINNVDMIKDPAPNVSIVEPGGTFGVGLSMGGGESGDVINLRIEDASGLVAQSNIFFNQVYRHTYWWTNFPFASDASGPHTLEIRLNGVLTATYPFDVQEIITGFRQVRHGVPAAQYQGLFDAMVANGYRLIWIDGYDVNGQTYFNVIFDQSVVDSWTSAHALTASAYQTFFNGQVAAGRRLVHIDSYIQNGTVRYAPIFVEQPGTAWVAYHAVDSTTHQNLFNDYASQGYRAAIISVEQNGSGALEFTALYDRQNVGGWVALANMTSAAYQTQFDAQTAAGRRLAYLNGYTINGTAYFTAIWNSIQPSLSVSRHDLTGSQFQNEFDTWTGQGLTTRFITGYQNGSIANFGAHWSN